MSESTTTETQEELHERQAQLEARAVEAGKAQYRNSLKIQGHAESVVGQRMIRTTIDPMIAALKHEFRTRRGVRSSVDHLIKDIDPLVLAMLTCRVIIQGITEDRQKAAVSMSLGHLIQEHLNWIALRKQAKGLTVVIEDQVKKTAHEKHRRAVCNHVTKKYQTEDRIEWTPKQSMGVGLKLIEMCAEHTTLIDIKTKHKRTGRGKVTKVQSIVATETTLATLENGHARMELTKPVYLPMIVKPRPWTDATSGGYLTRRNLLVKSKNPVLVDELMSVDLSKALTALNTLQDTAYRVNTGVLSVLTEARANGDRLPQLVSPEPLPRPAKPVDFETNKEAKTAWKNECTRIEAVNRALSSERLATYTMHSLAEEMSGEEAIYFPHQLDWRGRAYPLPGTLQPQGSDLAKALLHYAEAKPITEVGASWLKVHLANLFGEDKQSFDDRIKWTDDNTDALMACAMNPLDERMWQDADKPWQALAACFELTGYIMSGESPEYMSRLPVAMDGSCNGLQNLSAMLLDPIGGAATNLMPADVPQDIYTMVAERAMEKVEAMSRISVDMREAQRMVGSYRAARKLDKDLPRGDLDGALAQVWMDTGISRKVAKRPVMTKPYGATAFGMRDQIKAQLTDDCTFGTDKDFIYQMATFIAPVINEAINEVVIAARDVMDWLQEVATVAAKSGYPLCWTTPMGLPVMQDYRVAASKRVSVMIGGVKKRASVTESTSKIDIRRQAAGCSPNVIHSLDASHMMHTINCANAGSGITAFTMVHDSYATHACDIQELNEWLRFAFVDMYKGNVLEDLREQFARLVPDEVAAEFPAVPERGALDLNLVQDSLYFFA